MALIKGGPPLPPPTPPPPFRPPHVQHERTHSGAVGEDALARWQATRCTPMMRQVSGGTIDQGDSRSCSSRRVRLGKRRHRDVA